MRSAPRRGRCTTASSSPSTAATPRTSCSASSATGSPSVIEARRQNLARKELAWLRRGAPARTSKPKFRIDAANELIADEPEIRDKLALQSLAVSRLGKDVVDLLDASVSYGDREVLHAVEWRIAPGERTGILGVNGAGKSTLLGLVSGDVEPTAGRVKRGKTVQVATLTQRLDELEEHLNDPVRVVISRLRTTYEFGVGVEGAGAHPRSAARADGLRQRAAVHAGQGPLRRPEAAAAAAADPARAAQRADPRRADERPRHRHARRDGGPARLLAGHAHRRLARPVLPRARHRPAVRDPLRPPAAPARRRRRVPPAAQARAGRPGRRGERADRDGHGSARARRRRAAHRAEGARRAGATPRRSWRARSSRARAALADHDQADYVGIAAEMARIGGLETDREAAEARWFELSELLG